MNTFLAAAFLQRMAKKSAQLNVRIDPDVLDSLEAIENNHGITQSVLVRHLLAAVDAFYKKHKWFSLPVTVTPEKFQNTEAMSVPENRTVPVEVPAQTPRRKLRGVNHPNLEPGARAMAESLNAGRFGATQESIASQGQAIAAENKKKRRSRLAK